MSNNQNNARSCCDGNHIVGHVGVDGMVRLDQWDASVSRLEAAISDFNTRGRTQQVNHPGYCSRFNFCTECGASLSGLGLRDIVIKG